MSSRVTLGRGDKQFVNAKKMFGIRHFAGNVRERDKRVADSVPTQTCAWRGERRGREPELLMCFPRSFLVGMGRSRKG